MLYILKQRINSFSFYFGPPSIHYYFDFVLFFYLLFAIAMFILFGYSRSISKSFDALLHNIACTKHFSKHLFSKYTLKYYNENWKRCPLRIVAHFTILIVGELRFSKAHYTIFHRIKIDTILCTQRYIVLHSIVDWMNVRYMTGNWGSVTLFMMCPCKRATKRSNNTQIKRPTEPNRRLQTVLECVKCTLHIAHITYII